MGLHVFPIPIPPPTGDGVSWRWCEETEEAMIPQADCPGLGGEASMSTKVPIYLKLGSRKGKKKLWDLLRLDR